MAIRSSIAIVINNLKTKPTIFKATNFFPSETKINSSRLKFEKS